MLHMAMHRCTGDMRRLEKALTNRDEYVTDSQNLEEGVSFTKQFRDTLAKARAADGGSDPEGITYFHFIIWDDPEDGKSPEEMHEIVLNFAGRTFPGAQYFVSTEKELSSGSVRSHVVVNAANPATGGTIPVRGKDYADIKACLTAAGERHGIKPGTPGRKKSPEDMTWKERQIASRGGFSWKEDLRRKISAALGKAKNTEEFFRLLETDGIKVMRTWSGRDFVYLHPKARRPCGGERLGPGFTKAAVEEFFSKKAEVAADENFSDG